MFSSQCMGCAVHTGDPAVQSSAKEAQLHGHLSRPTTVRLPFRLPEQGDGGGEVSSLGDAKSSPGDAKSSLGDAKSFLGDAKSSLGDTQNSLGDAGVAGVPKGEPHRLDRRHPPRPAAACSG
jgi:hypothetical protein